MASVGMIVQDAPVAGITGTFASVLLQSDVAQDAKSLHGELPASGILGVLEFDLDVTAGAVTAIEVFLTWESAGDSIFQGLQRLTTADFELVAGQTDVSRLLGSVTYNRSFVAPAGQTAAGTCYAWFRVAAGGGTMSVLAARLTWHQPTLRG